MKYNFIKTKQEDFCYYLTLARAEKRNAFTPTMVNEIAHAIHEANTNPAIKLVILQAEGPVFCAGMDLKAFQDPAVDRPNPALEQQILSLGEVMDKLHKPSVAWVEGDVIAGAFLFIANCTYVFSRKDVRFRLPELAIGLFPFQVMVSLLKVMSEKQMLQLCLDTHYFDAAVARGYGLVDGYIEDLDLGLFVQRFQAFNGETLKAGIAAAKQLNAIPMADRYPYLLNELDQLREIAKVDDAFTKAHKS